MTVQHGAILHAGSVVLASMDVAQLRAELAITLTVTASHLVHLADVWRELERRGEDLSELKSGLWRYMPLIAKGDIEAELVVRYAGNGNLLRRLAKLPKSDQNQLTRTGKVLLVEFGNGRFEEREVLLQNLTSSEIARVVKDRIVSPDDQRRSLLGTTISGVVRSGRRLDDRTIAAARGRLARSRHRKDRKLTIALSDVEWAALVAWASKSNLDVASLVEGAVSLVGLLQDPTN